MASTFKDTPEDHSSLTFVTPPMVENTEVCGPMVLNLYASTTDTKVLWFVNLLEIDPAGNERVLTRGWLRGSQRRVDPEKSRPWQPYHPHDGREPLTPGEIYEFNIEIIPTGVLFKAGSRFAVRIKAADKDDRPAEITVHHNNRYPSPLFVPITKGNRIGTFMSGGVLESDAH
jgi:predicted acyl esterase